MTATNTINVDALLDQQSQIEMQLNTVRRPIAQSARVVMSTMNFDALRQIQSDAAKVAPQLAMIISNLLTCVDAVQLTCNLMDPPEVPDAPEA